MNNNKKTSSLLSLILLLALIVVGLFWFKPNFDEVNALKITEQAREQERDLARSTLDTLKQAQSSLQASSEIERETILSAIPERFEQDKVINLITDIAQKNDVNIGSISFSIPFNSQETIKKASVSLNLTGSEQDLLKMLRGIENSPRKLVVRSITVQFGRTENLERINFTISMDTYFQAGV